MSSAQKATCLALGFVLVTALVSASKICLGADSTQTLRLRAVYSAIGAAGLHSRHPRQFFRADAVGGSAV